MHRWFHAAVAVLLGVLALAVANRALAANSLEAHVLAIDLEPGIAEAATHRERFAVDVPHALSIADAGIWEIAGNLSVWRYAVRIPTAVSLSFHASRFALPAGATLAVIANDGTRVT